MGNKSSMQEIGLSCREAKATSLGCVSLKKLPNVKSRVTCGRIVVMQLPGTNDLILIANDILSYNQIVANDVVHGGFRSLLSSEHSYND